MIISLGTGAGMRGMGRWAGFAIAATWPACTWVPLGDATETITVPGPTRTEIVTTTVTVPVTRTTTVVTGDPGCSFTGGSRVCVLTGTLLEDRTLTADTLWILAGPVFVGTDLDDAFLEGDASVTLAIDPGTTVVGDAASGALLVVQRGSRLVAAGTEQAPIVFTSSAPIGSRARGDWGGIVINGRAPLNSCGSGVVDCDGTGRGGTGLFGGSDPDDFSGIVTNVIVEYAGRAIDETQSHAGLALYAVGAATEIDRVQIHRPGADGVVWIGGTVDARHVIVTGAAEDSFEWREGWVGRAQFLIGQQYPDLGVGGLVADNNLEDNDATPRSHPTLANVTLIGSPLLLVGEFGALLRRGTAGELWSTIIAGHEEGCLEITGSATLDQADGGALAMLYSHVDCAELYGGGTVVSTGDIASWYEGGTSNSLDGLAPYDGGLTNPFDLVAPDFKPVLGSDLETGGAVPGDPWFTPTIYQGAVDPADDWTAGFIHTDVE